MDRRSGLKKAHFSSVPTNESFYLQKVCFSDRENFPNLTASTQK
ncbi:Hypothetical protein G436_1661 [Leptospira interrogans serovar Hardjo str. Norma]|uniref:Uncharacterized protein n=1 Tax=Leptospira interrogans serovar Hardjo str. Norma TaxID=1279460 RepID=A0A0M3TLC5_LEPIR|nr:Hypothetical protein G436_1661 [Leptospira interrogans serovar Hardjo str. Norma]